MDGSGTGLVVCLEGMSAVGKTTLAAALGAECGVPVVPELDASGAPPVGESAAWFVDRHAERWREARDAAAGAPFAVMDCDPFKGFWYHWIFADDGWRGVEVVEPLYRAHLEAGTIGFPDLYFFLEADVAQLRHRRANDPTRSRRGFEGNLRMVGPQRRYFEALHAFAPGRVAFLDTTDRAALVGRVTAALARLPAERPDPFRLLDHLAEWVRSNPPHPPSDGPG